MLNESEDMAESNKSEESTLVVTGHGVASFPDWLNVFSTVSNAPLEENVHVNQYKTKYHLAGKQKNPEQGAEDRILVLGISDSSNDAFMAEALKYEGEPFDTFKKEGTMVPPFFPNTMGRLVLDRWDVPKEDFGSALEETPDEYMVYVASHGVPTFDRWYTEAFGGGAPMPAELRDSLGCVRTLVAQGPNRRVATSGEEQEETCIVVHVFQKSCYDAFAALARYDAPPFVGGPDFIGNGLVVLPLDINLFADASFSIEYPSC